MQTQVHNVDAAALIQTLNRARQVLLDNGILANDGSGNASVELLINQVARIATGNLEIEGHAVMFFDPFTVGPQWFTQTDNCYTANSDRLGCRD